MTITAEQCRAARALLDWGQPELSKKAKVDRKTIYTFEKGEEITTPIMRRIRKAFGKAGIVFLDGKEGGYLPTVALKHDYVKTLPPTVTVTVEQDAGLIEYWKANPELWKKMSDGEKQALMERMGISDEGEIFGEQEDPAE
jgi:DNA-binding XRE family transcriptional regulator